MSRGFQGFQGLGFRGVRFRVWGLGLFQLGVPGVCI